MADDSRRVFTHQWIIGGRAYRVERVGRSVDVVTDFNGWRFAVRIALVDGRPVPAAVDVHPIDGALPRSGVTSRVVAQVRLPAHLQALLRLWKVRLRVTASPLGPRARPPESLVDFLRGSDLDGLAREGRVRQHRLKEAPTSPGRRRVGRPRIERDDLLRKVTRAYVRAFEQTEHLPSRRRGLYAKVGRALGIDDVARIRYLVHLARKREFLSDTKQGIGKGEFGDAYYESTKRKGARR